MKTRIINSSLILIVAAYGIIFFAGCASTETNKISSPFNPRVIVTFL
jgi:hypothetical protein